MATKSTKKDSTNGSAKTKKRKVEEEAEEDTEEEKGTEEPKTKRQKVEVDVPKGVVFNKTEKLETTTGVAKKIPPALEAFRSAVEQFLDSCGKNPQKLHEAAKIMSTMSGF